jgi:hypothetical protein
MTYDEKLKTTITETWHLCSHRCCPISKPVLHSRHCQWWQWLIEQAEEALLVLLLWLLTLRQDVQLLHEDHLTAGNRVELRSRLVRQALTGLTLGSPLPWWLQLLILLWLQLVILQIQSILPLEWGIPRQRRLR